jgi:hypothetical protein
MPADLSARSPLGLTEPVRTTGSHLWGEGARSRILDGGRVAWALVTGAPPTGPDATRLGGYLSSPYCLSFRQSVVRPMPRASAARD